MGRTQRKPAIFSRARIVVDIAGQVEVGQPVAVVGQKHLLALRGVRTALRRWPILALMPVSTKVILQSWMSLFSSWTSRPPRVRTKSFEMVSS